MKKIFKRFSVHFLLIIILFNTSKATGQSRETRFNTSRTKIPFHSRAAIYPLIQEGPLTNPYESLVFGNGDLAASAQVFSHELVLTLGKNDVWDSRIGRLTKDALITQDELIESNGTDNRLKDHSTFYSIDYVYKTAQGPTPKPVGQIRIVHPGLSNTGIISRLEIHRGVLTVEYQFPEGNLIVESYVHRLKNLVMLKLSANGAIPWLRILMEKLPDRADPEMPEPFISAGEDDRQWAISQTIPGKYNVEDFSWHMAGSFPPDNACTNASYVMRWPYALQQEITLRDGESVVFAVGVATDRDGEEEALTRAFDLAGNFSQKEYNEELGSHEQAWNNFWSASAIQLEDSELEALWYRTLFGFACHLKPGAQAPGLNANIPIYDYTAWNGAYTWNHNVQKWYVPSLPVNHPEWYDILADLVDQNMPIFEYLAAEIFGLEGVYIDIMTIPFSPPYRTISHSVFGRALSHAGWISSMLYQHYEFTCDKNWLRDRAYPFIRKTADFYVAYLDKYQDVDGDIWPSMLLEDTGNWEPGFTKSRNVLTDLILFKKSFEIASEASEILDIDVDKREMWQKYISRVPDVEYGWKDGKGWYAIYKNWDKIWPDFEEYLHHIRTSRWGCSGWLVFPGEYIQGDEPGGLAEVVRDVVSRTDLLNLPDRTRQLGTFHGEANFLPFIRMGLMDKFDDLRTLMLNHRFSNGQFSPYSTGENVYIRTFFTDSWRIVENQYFPILGITEMLLQSQGNVIRLFPFWPEDKSAGFQGLRARSGFTVSAEKEKEGNIHASITSGCGGTCRIRWDQHSTFHLICEGNSVKYEIEEKDIVFNTKPGKTYFLQIQQTSH
jgi:hypothetical protein